MAKYRFYCEVCKVEVEKFASPKTEEIDCSTCASKMGRKLPNSGSQAVREVIDPYTNIRTAPDERAQNNARKTEYFWENEVPRLIQTYSVETCLQEGWLVYNDKGELVIGKSPSKR